MNRISLTLFATIFASSWLAAQDEPANPPSGEATVATANKTPAVPSVQPTAIPFVSDKPLVQTEIEAESLRAELTEDTGYLIGVGSVKLVATNLQITCNQIEVYTNVKDKKNNDTIGDISSIQKIIATGNVKIVQDQRTATAGLAEVYPNDDFILLDKDPILYQGSITIDGTGAQLKIYRGNGRVEWIGDPNNKIHISAPPLQDLGFEKKKESITPSSEEAATGGESAAAPTPKAESTPNRKNNNNNRARNNP